MKSPVKQAPTGNPAPERYCEHCGAKCLVYTESAVGWGPPFSMYYGYERCDDETGLEQLMWVYECPHRRFKGCFGFMREDQRHTRGGIRKNF